MVKFGKSKLKALNKLDKKRKVSLGNDTNFINATNVTNKVIKKKVNIQKKVSFHKEVLLKETAGSETLVKKLSKTDIALQNLFKKSETDKKPNDSDKKKPKIKAVEKQKKRQKTQISDTKLLLNLMKKKKN